MALLYAAPAPAPSHGPSPDSRYSGRTGLRNGLIQSAVGILGTALLIMAGTANNPDVHPATVSIQDPVKFKSSTGKVSRVLTIAGSVQVRRNTNLRTLWIVAQTSDGRYFPQGAAVLEDDNWSCLVSLGAPSRGDDGPYHVLAVMADAAGSQAMQEYTGTQLAKRSSGMADYPSSDHIRTVADLRLTRAYHYHKDRTRPHPDRGCRR